MDAAGQPLQNADAKGKKLKTPMLIMAPHGQWQLNDSDQLKEFDLALRVIIEHEGIMPRFLPGTVSREL